MLSSNAEPRVELSTAKAVAAHEPVQEVCPKANGLDNVPVQLEFPSHFNPETFAVLLSNPVAVSLGQLNWKLPMAAIAA
jgi:hypothetical protein